MKRLETIWEVLELPARRTGETPHLCKASIQIRKIISQQRSRKTWPMFYKVNKTWPNQKTEIDPKEMQIYELFYKAFKTAIIKMLT